MTKPSRMAVLALCTFLMATQLHAAGKSKQDNKTAISKKNSRKKAQIPKGRLLLDVYECLGCHSLEGNGFKDGLALDRLKRSRTFLIDHILDPETHVENNREAYKNEPNMMPTYQLSPKEAADIADYLLSLSNRTRKGGKHAGTNSNEKGGQ